MGIALSRGEKVIYGSTSIRDSDRVPYMTDPDVRGTAPVAVSPTHRISPRPTPWAGTTIMLRHFDDGSVAASSRGLVGVGESEREALADLARLLNEAGATRGTDR